MREVNSAGRGQLSGQTEIAPPSNKKSFPPRTFLRFGPAARSDAIASFCSSRSRARFCPAFCCSSSSSPSSPPLSDLTNPPTSRAAAVLRLCQTLLKLVNEKLMLASVGWAVSSVGAAVCDASEEVERTSAAVAGASPRCRGEAIFLGDVFQIVCTWRASWNWRCDLAREARKERLAHLDEPEAGARPCRASYPECT